MDQSAAVHLGCIALSPSLSTALQWRHDGVDPAVSQGRSQDGSEQNWHEDVELRFHEPRLSRATHVGRSPTAGPKGEGDDEERYEVATAHIDHSGDADDQSFRRTLISSRPRPIVRSIVFTCRHLLCM